MSKQQPYKKNPRLIFITITLRNLKRILQNSERNTFRFPFPTKKKQNGRLVNKSHAFFYK